MKAGINIRYKYTAVSYTCLLCPILVPDVDAFRQASTSSTSIGDSKLVRQKQLWKAFLLVFTCD